MKKLIILFITTFLLYSCGGEVEKQSSENEVKTVSNKYEVIINSAGKKDVLIDGNYLDYKDLYVYKDGNFRYKDLNGIYHLIVDGKEIYTGSKVSLYKNGDYFYSEYSEELGIYQYFLIREGKVLLEGEGNIKEIVSYDDGHYAMIYFKSHEDYKFNELYKDGELVGYSCLLKYTEGKTKIFKEWGGYHGDVYCMLGENGEIEGVTDYDKLGYGIAFNKKVFDKEKNKNCIVDKRKIYVCIDNQIDFIEDGSYKWETGHNEDIKYFLKGKIEEVTKGGDIVIIE